MRVLWLVTLATAPEICSANPQSAAPVMILETSGQVSAIDAHQGTLQVSPVPFGLLSGLTVASPMTFQTTLLTTIERGGQFLRLTDLELGDRVNVRHRVRRGESVAECIVVTRPAAEAGLRLVNDATASTSAPAYIP